MAYQELYITIARMVYLFHIQSEDAEEMKHNFELLDHFSECKFHDLAFAKVLNPT